MANPSHFSNMQQVSFANSTPNGVAIGGNGYGTVTRYICGKAGHYSMNCWQTSARLSSQPPIDNDTAKMRDFYKRAVQREKEECERKAKEEMEKRRLEEDQRRESERILNAEAREARLEATIARLLAQQNRTNYAITATPATVRKKSPTSKARMLREIRSYIGESEDESEEVREEAGKLVDAIERRKKAGKVKAPVEEEEERSTRVVKRPREKTVEANQDPDDECLKTPRKGLSASCSNEGMIEYALEVHKRMSAKKVPEIRKICSKEGIKWSKRDEVICELVRCRTKLAYEGFVERKEDISPLNEK
ncbi:hypothetical protein CBR_g8071 [Chara braunii]|uniref:CCHC-type domain-containing protein n=1 Tax=Chara braunii TaxID=69332 RepID=A0A388KLE0_CHABU|nr:hypothetical protein CBR_g8071 [Chara braunii]|eukprot:GBG70773.1 hypothetical protein CBR_g8071 [Chara braunii]